MNTQKMNELSAEKLREELINANQLLRTVIDENPNIIIMKDWNGKFLIGNRALAKLYGTTPENLEGKDDGAFNPNAEQVAFYLQNVREIMSQDETQIVMEESTNSATGETHYYQSIKKPLITASGEKQILVIANDVTELKMAQKRLEESERRLSYVLDATGEGVWDWDIRSGIVTHNSQWCKIIGLTDDFLSHPLEKFVDLLHEDDRARVHASLQACLEGSSHYQSEHRMRLANDHVVWVLDRGGVVERDAEGKPLRMVGSFVDITERKEVELALATRTALLDAIFELSPDGFISFDENKRVTYVSPGFTHMTGLDAARLVGLEEQDFSDKLAQLCGTDSSFNGIEDLNKTNVNCEHDERVLIELAQPVKRVLEVGLRTGDVSSVSQIMYFHEVTYETEVSHMKSEFMSTAAHELRTPMASIYGFAELLLANDFDESSRNEFLNIIFKQSSLMSSILNELLDLARIEERRGKDFILETIPAQDLISEVVIEFKLPNGRMAPVLIMPSRVTHMIADHKKVYQAILNVLSNAYKYSPGGGQITIELIASSADQPSEMEMPAIGIRISDMGIGMTEAQQERVFERFYRADNSGKITGTGLGMSIVKEIVLLHGGLVTLESALGTGTTVTLWLPAAPSLSSDSHLDAAAE